LLRKRSEPFFAKNGKIPPVKEKAVMTSMMAATLADVGTTMVNLSSGFMETGYSTATLHLEGHMEVAYVAKVAASAVLIGIYALTARKNNEWAWGYDKIMKIMSVAMWWYPVLNTVALAKTLSGH